MFSPSIYFDNNLYLKQIERALIASPQFCVPTTDAATECGTSLGKIMNDTRITGFPSGIPGLMSILFTLLFLGAGIALADVDVSDTVIEGTDNDDTIAVSGPTDVSALALIAEPGKATATATVVDAKDGTDFVSTSDTVTSTADASGAFVAPLLFDDGDLIPNGDDKEIKLSIETEATATGLEGGDGNDTLLNGAPIDSFAITTSGGTADQLDVSLTEDATVKSESTAKSSAFGIKAGDGDDAVTANNPIDATATATSGALTVGVVIGDSTNTTRNVNSKMEATAKAEAEATGIEGDKGIDTVTIADDVTTEATAISGSAAASIGVEVSGSASTVVKSEAKATGTAVSTGADNDTVTNAGTLTATSTALAGAVSFDMEIANPAPAGGGEKKKDKEDKSSSETSVTAEATATGIDTDGSADTQDKDFNIDFVDNRIVVDWHNNEVSTGGDDVVDNRGDITTTALSASRSDGAAITIGTAGSAESKSNSTSKATSTGIATGGGSDQITNTAIIKSTSGAAASAVSLGLAAGQSSDENNDIKLTTKSTTKAEATASAIGIDAEGDASQKTLSGNVSVGLTGLTTNVQWGQVSAAADDVVDNAGEIIILSGATADSTEASIEIQASGSVESDSSATAKADGIAINTGAGSDTVVNIGALSTLVSADAGAVGLSLSVTEATNDKDDDPPGDKKDKSNIKSEASATTTASAIGIDAEGTAHDKNNVVNVDISGSGLYVDVDVESTSLAGEDTVDNDGTITSIANATSGAIAASVDIQAAGSVESKADAKATTKAGGIYTGGGEDTIDNSGGITAVATSTSGALSVGVTVEQPSTEEDPVTGILDKLKGLFASTHSTANATTVATTFGIDAEGEEHDQSTTFSASIDGDGIAITFDHESLTSSSDDIVANSGAINLHSIATSGAGAGEVRVQAGGTASSEANAKATAKSTGINTGGGSDSISHSGSIIADSFATSGAVAVSFSQDGPGAESKAEAKATSESESIGIAADSGADTIFNVAHSISEDGISSSFHYEKTAASGDDIVGSTGSVEAFATSTSGLVAAAVTIDGSASTNVKGTAKSNAIGIETGNGDDQVSSDGVVGAAATSTAAAVAASVGTNSEDKGKGKAKVEGETLAEATATGISTDGGDADSLIDFSLTINGDGIVSSFETSTTAASGDDLIEARGSITSVATATSALVEVPVQIKGAAEAKADSEAKAEAWGINTGGGTDAIDNRASIDAISTATAATASVAVSTKGNAISNAGVLGAGTTANASATGISSSGTDYAKSLTVDTNIDFNSIGVEVNVESSKDSMTTDGIDTIANSGNVKTFSTATAPQVTAAVTSKGIAASVGRAKANSTSTAIESGNMGDTIDNAGDLHSTALSSAYMANVAVTSKGLAVAGNSTWDGGTEAEAAATGIDADNGSVSTHTTNVEVSLERAQIVYTSETLYASGDDTIVNTGEITTIAGALAPGVSVAVAPKGVAAAVSTSTAKSESTGIKGGDGNDDIDNTGRIESHSEAIATTANVAVTNTGAAVAADSVWDGGTKATANATGIAGDGGDRSKTTRLAIGTDEMSFSSTTEVAQGSDTIYNEGDILADANAGAASVSGTYVGKGIGIATATSTSKAEATAIDAGEAEDDDVVDNFGDLEANARSGAVSSSISYTNSGVAIAADAFWDGGTGAEAKSSGIKVGGGNDLINNAGNIETSSIAVAGSLSVGVAIKGVAGAVAASTADAHTIGIDAGEGVDTVNNQGSVDTIASATSGSAGVAVAGSGVALASAWSTSNSTATAIDTGDIADDDEVTNDGDLSAFANSNAVSASVSVTKAGVAGSVGAVWDGGTKADSRARGIDVGAGLVGDYIANSGNMDIDAVSVTGAASVSVALAGVAVSVATSTGTSDATAIDASQGDDADTVLNSGNLDVNSDAFAATVGVTITKGGVAIATDSVWDGGTKATARGRGIETGQGADEIQNAGNIDVLSISGTGSVQVALPIAAGVGIAVATATSNADATAIDAGEDESDDLVLNEGDIDVDADAVAASAAVSFTLAGVVGAGGTPWDGGTTANALARGIFVGEGNDTVQNTGVIEVDSLATASATSEAVAIAGAAGAVSSANTTSESLGIDTAGGDDIIINSGRVDTHALANTNTVTAAGAKFGVSVAGNNAWDGGTMAIASTTGINAGAGEDIIDNDGEIEATAQAIAPNATVTFTVGGVSASISTATARADATAIDAGDDNDVVDNSGDLTLGTTAIAASMNAAITGIGVSAAGDSVWDGGTTGTAVSTGITGGQGEDTIINSGDVDGTALVVAPSASVAFTVGGVSASTSTATANAEITGLDGADDDDRIDNSGDLTISSDAIAVAANVAITGVGATVAADAVWDGGTTSTALADGIEGGAGNDTITSAEGNLVDATATSKAESASLSYSGIGFAASTSTATANADANAINAGSGDDIVINDSDLTSLADANAAGVSVSVTGIGGAFAADSIWDGGTKANANATGINLGTGNDEAANTGTITTTADSDTLSVSGAITGYGVAGSFAASTSTADAAAMDGGEGDDLLINEGTLNSKAEADAIGVSLSMSQVGAAIAGSFLDNATRANSSATGIEGDEGVDQLRNATDAYIDVTSNATTSDAAIAIALFGVATADSNAVSTAEGIGLDGGDGDDVILNEGTIKATSIAEAQSRAITISIASGAPPVEEIVTTSANAVGFSDTTGIAGGAGDDIIENRGMIDVSSKALSVGQTFSLTGIGANVSEANADAVVTATGISGDAGADSLVNSGQIIVGSLADTDARNIGVGVVGLTVSKANSTATTNSTGIDGGDDNDTIINTESGFIDVVSVADTYANAVTIQVAGSGATEARAAPVAMANGLVGGAGDDGIQNDGDVTVMAKSRSYAASTTVTVFGDSSAKAGTEVESEATGISGGLGNDTLINTGTLQVGPAADADADAFYMSVLEADAYTAGFSGSGEAQSGAYAETSTTGMDGGDGGDLIVNSGDIDVLATAQSKTSASTMSVFGGGDAKAKSGAFTDATGFAGGMGDDVIINEETGTVDVTAETNTFADATSYSFAGGGDTGAQLEGDSTAIGFRGDAGNDELFNYGTLNVTALADLTSKGGTSATFDGGSTYATSKTAATSFAAAMKGGDGNDTLANSGDTSVAATSIARAQNNSSSTASFSSDNIAGSISEATAEAVGLAGGDGTNILSNDANLAVTANSTAYSFAYANGATFSFDGDAMSRTDSLAVSTATGILAGDGDNVVLNDGQLTVTATAGTAEDLVSSIVSYRLQGDYQDSPERPDDKIAEEVDEEPDWSDSSVQAQYSNGDILYCTGADCDIDTTVSSAGRHYEVVVTSVDHDNDNSTDPIDEYSWEPVEALDNTPDMSDAANQALYADGDIVACRAVSCREETDINSTATFWQLVVTTSGDPPVDEYDWQPVIGLFIEISADITEASFPSYSVANANGMDGDGDAGAIGSTEAYAYGVRLGDGNNEIRSNDLIVEAVANTNVNVASDGDVIGDAWGTSTANAVAEAVGIVLGIGDDTVWNTGLLSVTATPSAQAHTAATAGDGICIWFFVWLCAGDGTSTVNANADFTAIASGILAGDGDNTIVNDGTISVSAIPTIATDVRRDDDQYAAIARGDNRTMTVTSSSTAIGIQTGVGNDTIINNGDIVVEAWDVLSSCEEEAGDCGVTIDDQSVLSAIGVQTGDGDDAVTNNGTISAFTYTDSIPATTIAIDLGAGDDTLTLGDGSSTIGTITLGEGDDRLILMGTPVAMEDGSAVFSLPGGAGYDGLLLFGDGSFTAQLIGFEHATKYNPGTYWLPGLAPLSTLTIDGGTLALGSSYDFRPDGAFFTYFDVEGEHGLFDIEGSSVLDGAITVKRRSDGYISDDSRYTLVAASGGVSNAFADITLPESRPLLSFALEQTPTTVDLVINAEPFESMALDRLHRFVATNLTTIADNATGEFNTHMGTIQNMEDGFEIVYASLAPDTFQALTANTVSMAHETTQLLRNHLSDARAFARGETPVAAAYEPVTLLYDGANFQTARLRGLAVAPSVYLAENETAETVSGSSSQWMTWMGVYSASGDYDQVDGYTQFDHDAAGLSVGLDRVLDNDWVVGFTAGFNDSDIKMYEAVADAAVESWSGSLYAMKYNDRNYIEGGLYFSGQKIESARTVTLDTLEQRATSSHDGDTLMAFLAGGRRFDFESWYIEPYGSLFYFDISEDGFEETGASSLSLAFNKKSVDALFGEIGARLMRSHETGRGLLNLHATLAYNHDFRIDDMNIEYAYTGEPDQFFIIPDRIVKSDSAVFAAGLAYVRGRSTLGIDYRGQYNSAYTNHIVGARFGYEF